MQGGLAMMRLYNTEYSVEPGFINVPCCSSGSLIELYTVKLTYVLGTVPTIMSGLVELVCTVEPNGQGAAISSTS